MASIFDKKYYNPEVFKGSIDSIRDSERLEIVRAFTRNVDSEMALLFPAQLGGNKATIVIHGNLGGTALNYDGSTDLVAGDTTNYAQTVIAIGRMFGWKEKDFVKSIAGRSELDSQAYQVAMFQDKQVKEAGLAILKGLYSASGVLASTKQTATEVKAEGLNDAIVAVCGDMGTEFDVVAMDSYVAGQLANLKLLEYAKYNDANGIERVDHRIGYWGGKLVIIDDACGTNSGASGSVHTVFVLAPYSFAYTELGVKVPIELARDPYSAGGVDTLIERQRFVLAPYGVSWKGADSIVSPTKAQLETVGNWELVEDGEGNPIDTKILPFACLEITLA